MMNQEKQIPKLTMEQAIACAQRHLAENKIDLSSRFLAEASWGAATGSDEGCWRLQWMTDEQFKKLQINPHMRGGGHLCVQVFNDSRVDYSFAR